MGLIKLQVDAGQYNSNFKCDTLSPATLICKETGDVTDGARIDVADGQAVIIVEDGKVIEFSAEPGSFAFDTAHEPSCFTGAGYKGMLDSFKKKGGKFTYGGDPAKKQSVYYFNLNEISGAKFGTSCAVKYNDPYYKMELNIRFYGHYTLRICDPILLFASAADSIGNEYTCDAMFELTLGEFMPALCDALGAAEKAGIRFTGLVSATEELSAHVCEALNEQWRERCGIEVTGVSIDGVTTDERTKAKIKEIDDYILRTGGDANTAEAHAVHMDALKKAADGKARSFSALMAMGASDQDENKTWICPVCKHEISSKFCPECGYKRK